jgi:KUP system potassium uptake protein
VTLIAMLSWRKGRAVAFAKRDADAQALDSFIAGLSRPDAPMRMPGTAVYLTKQSENVPSALALNLKHNGIVHEHVLLLRVSTERAPRVPEAERVRVKDFSNGLRQVQIRFGFAEKPDVPAALTAHQAAVGCDPATASFFLGREEPVPSLRPDVPRWQERIYAFMTRNAVRAPDYFLIPPQRVVELGTKVEM